MITAIFILEGAMYALEHCGIQLKNAVTLPLVAASAVIGQSAMVREGETPAEPEGERWLGRSVAQPRPPCPIRRRTVDREKAKTCINFLGQPMGWALHAKLKGAQETWKESGDDATLARK